MGRRGPPPTPTNVLIQRGSWRAKLREGKEPEFPKVRPACPAWLDEDAKAEWRRLVPVLEAAGLLTEGDRNMLARYCRMLSRYKKADEFLRQHGEHFPIRVNGEVVGFETFPQVAIVRSLGEGLFRIEREFGLSPSARVGFASQGLKNATEEKPEGKSRFFA